MAECKHKWVYLETVKRVESHGYNSEYIKVDRFYCEKCLEQKETRKSEYLRETPEWY